VIDTQDEMEEETTTFTGLVNDHVVGCFCCEEEQSSEPQGKQDPSRKATGTSWHWDWTAFTA